MPLLPSLEMAQVGIVLTIIKLLLLEEKLSKKQNKTKKLGYTWVAGVLLIEAIDSTKHEVEDHLAVWIVHA